MGFYVFSRENLKYFLKGPCCCSPLFLLLGVLLYKHSCKESLSILTQDAFKTFKRGVSKTPI